MEMNITPQTITHMVKHGMADAIASEMLRLEAENKKLRKHSDAMCEWICEHITGQNPCLDPQDIVNAYVDSKRVKMEMTVVSEGEKHDQTDKACHITFGFNSVEEFERDVVSAREVIPSLLAAAKEGKA
jgi:hypothetical protein